MTDDVPADVCPHCETILVAPDDDQLAYHMAGECRDGTNHNSADLEWTSNTNSTAFTGFTTTNGTSNTSFTI